MHIVVKGMFFVYKSEFQYWLQAVVSLGELLSILKCLFHHL